MRKKIEGKVDITYEECQVIMKKFKGLLIRFYNNNKKLFRQATVSIKDLEQESYLIIIRALQIARIKKYKNELFDKYIHGAILKGLAGFLEKIKKEFLVLIVDGKEKIKSDKEKVIEREERKQLKKRKNKKLSREIKRRKENESYIPRFSDLSYIANFIKIDESIRYLPLIKSLLTDDEYKIFYDFIIEGKGFLDIGKTISPKLSKAGVRKKYCVIISKLKRMFKTGRVV